MQAATLCFIAAALALTLPDAAFAKKAADRDGDGLSSSFERKHSKTDPRKADTDGDGLADGYEIRQSKTSARKADTDGDGTGDGIEVLFGRNPRKKDGPPRNFQPEIPALPGTPDVPLPLPDLVPPETTIDSGPSGTVASGDASFGFSSSEPGSTFECRRNNGSWQDCTSPRSYSNLSNGTHTFRVRATDASGNPDPIPASRTWVVDAPPADTAAPNTTISSGPSGTVDSSEATFGFDSSEAGSSFECRLDGGGYQDCTSPRTYSNLSNGSHTFRVRATDAAGNTDGSAATRTWTVDVDTPPPADTTPPNTTITSGPSGTVDTANASFSFASSEADSSFECRIDGGSWDGCTSPRNYADLSNGSHTFEVRATDAADNTDGSPASRTWTVDVSTEPPPPPDDTTAPDTTITGGPSGTVSNNAASFSFSSSEAGSTFQCRLDAGSWQNCSSPRGYADLSNGSHTFDVRATDASNNTDGTPATRTWNVEVTAPPPSGECDLNATTSNFSSQVAAATAGQTVCLASGSYGNWTGTNKAIVIKPQPGASPTMKLNFSTPQGGLVIDGLGGLGTSQDVRATAGNFTIRNSTFTSNFRVVSRSVTTPILLDNNTHMNISNVESRVGVYGSNGEGVVIRNSSLGGGDADGVRLDAPGVQVLNNSFTQFTDVGANHTDPIQFYGSGRNAIIRGNYFNNTGGEVASLISAWDGTRDNIIEENVFAGTGTFYTVSLLGDRNSIVRKNSAQRGSCLSSTPCGTMQVSSKSGLSAGSGTIIRDNVMANLSVGNATYTADHNLTQNRVTGEGNIQGTPQFVGPMSSYEGFRLATGSPGRSAASDGTDIGIP